MIALQEELDWRCYRLYGLHDDAPEHPNPPPLQLGERAFEIVMARRMAAGELETAWFERHRSTPITELPTALAGRLSRGRRTPHRPHRVGPHHRPDRAARIQAPLVAGPMGGDGARGPARWLLDRLEDPLSGRRTHPASSRRAPSPTPRVATPTSLPSPNSTPAAPASISTRSSPNSCSRRSPCHSSPPCVTAKLACANARTGKRLGKSSAPRTR